MPTRPKQQPMLTRGNFGGRIYVVTRYRVQHDNGDGTALFEALEKFDITEQFHKLAAELAGDDDPRSGEQT